MDLESAAIRESEKADELEKHMREEIHQEKQRVIEEVYKMLREDNKSPLPEGLRGCKSSKVVTVKNDSFNGEATEIEKFKYEKKIGSL